MRAVVARANALFLDCFEIFIAPLEAELGVHVGHVIGRSHSAMDNEGLLPPHRGRELRDGPRRRVSNRELAEADVILVGRVAQRQDADLPLPRDAVRHPRRELPADAGGLREHASCPRRCSAARPALRPDHQARAAARDPQASAGPAASYAELANCGFEVREAESAHAPRGHPLLDATTQVDRGDRHHHPARAAHPAARSTEGPGLPRRNAAAPRAAPRAGRRSA